MRSWKGWASAIAGAAIVLALLAFPWRLDPSQVAERLEAALPLPPGLAWAPPRRAKLTLFPRPMVDIDDLRIVHDDGREALDASSAAASLSILGLLAGRVEVSQARLGDASVDIDFDALRGLGLGRVETFRPRLQRLILEGGRVRLHSRRLGLDDEISPLEGSISWPAKTAAIDFELDGVWRDEIVEGDGEIASPAALIAGGASDVRLRIGSAPLSLTLEGAWTRGAKPGFAGEATLKAPSLAGLGRWLGSAPLRAAAPASIAASGQLAISGKAATLVNATFTLDGQDFEGSLGLSHGARWLAEATLATDNLQLEKFFGEPRAPVGAAGVWSRLAWKPPLNPKVDIDVRISAAHVTWGSFALSDAALAAERRAGDWKLEILDGGLAKGSITAEAELAGCAAICREHLKLSLAGVDLAELTRAFGRQRLSGRASFDLAAEAEGDDAGTIVRTARGEASLKAENGAIEGVGFEEALRRSQRRPLEVARDLAEGDTTFTTAEAKLAIHDGEARVETAQLAGPGAIVDASGVIDLAGCAWGIDVAAAQANSEGAPSPGAVRLELAVDGPWAAPSLSVTLPPRPPAP
ncbi:MAG: AsmA family protein [Roseiarcus sp.]